MGDELAASKQRDIFNFSNSFPGVNYVSDTFDVQTFNFRIKTFLSWKELSNFTAYEECKLEFVFILSWMSL